MLIKNANIITEKGCEVGDLRIDGEIISGIGTGFLPGAGERVVEAGGKYLLPGGVDAHTHLSCNPELFYEGTVAAACGGTTTIIDYPPFGPRGCGLLSQIDVCCKQAKDAAIDYSFHGVAQHLNGDVLKDMEELVSRGISSLKIYTAFEYKLGQHAMIPILKRGRELGMLVAVHAEDDEIIKGLREVFPNNPSLSRPEKAEAEAVERVLRICRALNDAPIYLVHISSAMSLEKISEARAAGQKNIYAETCPQYLFLDSTRYDQPDAVKYLMTPPLRSRKNRDKLMNALAGGEIQTAATNHYSIGKQGDYNTPGGVPGVEHRMALLFGKGVLTGRLNPKRFAEITATSPAKLFGLYPRKGVIAPGSDADLVLMGPGDITIGPGILCEDSPYSGLRPGARAFMTISRGEVVAEADELGVRFVGEKGRGRFLKRGV